MNVETSPFGHSHPWSRPLRTLTRVAVVAICAGVASAESPARLPWTTWSHTRPLSPGVINLIEGASERSLIVTRLMKELEATDLVVYVSDSMPGVNAGPKSNLAFLAREGGLRYVMVRIDFWRLSPPERIAALGHELQHALEIAAAPEVKSAASLAELYRRIGWEGHEGRFESGDAQDTGHRVRAQLDRSGV